MRPFRITLSVFLFAIGFSCLVVSQPGITGAVIGVQPSGWLSPFGFVAALASGIIFASGIEPGVRVVSVLKKNKSLVRLAEEAAENDRAQAGLDNLTKEMSKGNVPARVRHLEGTDVFYIGNAEARLYYRIIKGGYEIVAKSGKGSNQKRVIDKLEGLYKK